MQRYTSQSQRAFLKLLRTLVSTYHRLIELDAHYLRSSGLTQTQFDIIATLGNTEGMVMRELSEKTLISKGALTGVVDRLQEKGLVQRKNNPNDRRSTIIALTRKGDGVFVKVFPKHVEALGNHFKTMKRSEMAEALHSLERLSACLEKPH